ncbi:hypothetical protein OUZ56_028826 [Daphnia magna]|uniref:Uncharacterized protein n=1 Tax=Daphnia magna TaxID=35525 RepID=A0ABR0B508_9CRUS|nr:hypothetical protein OUZ56_028826 [Daphnia magna]
MEYSARKNMWARLVIGRVSSVLYTIKDEEAFALSPVPGSKEDRLSNEAPGPLERLHLFICTQFLHISSSFREQIVDGPLGVLLIHHKSATGR